MDFGHAVPGEGPQVVCVVAAPDVGPLRNGRVVVVEEASQTGGFAGEVVATIVEECFWSLEAPVVRVSGLDVPYPVGMVEDAFVPDEARITAAVRRSLETA